MTSKDIDKYYEKEIENNSYYNKYSKEGKYIEWLKSKIIEIYEYDNETLNIFEDE